MAPTPDDWRPVVGIEGIYEVSSSGRIRRIATCNAFPAPREITAQVTAGYLSILLRIDGRRRRFLIHRLVAFAFIGAPPTPAHEVAHWDNDRLNCRVSNLRWATPAENQFDKHRHGTMPDQRGSRNHAAKLTESDIAEIRRLRIDGLLQREIADRFDVNRSLISMVLSGQRWAHTEAYNAHAT